MDYLFQDGNKTKKSTKTSSKKGGNFLGSVGELVAPSGWESFATTAGLFALDRADAALRRGKSVKSSAKKGGESKTSSKKTSSKKGGNFLGEVGDLVAPSGWESFATTAGLFALDRADAALRRGKSVKSSTKNGGQSKTSSKKGGNFLGSVGELVAPSGWESFATTAGLFALDRADAALRRGKSEKSSAKKAEMKGGSNANKNKEQRMTQIILQEFIDEPEQHLGQTYPKSTLNWDRELKLSRDLLHSGKIYDQEKINQLIEFAKRKRQNRLKRFQNSKNSLEKEKGKRIDWAPLGSSGVQR
jgi:hypothetical protein